MNQSLMFGISLVNLAFILYTVFFILKRKSEKLTLTTPIVLSIAVLSDICATGLMILGSTNRGLTFHGVLGYLALLGMMIESVLLWKHFLGKNRDLPLSINLIRYTGIAYLWWLFVYVFGLVRILI
jgi:glucose-6-phosphate-specific signal transduction histidine kinase